MDRILEGSEIETLEKLLQRIRSHKTPKPKSEVYKLLCQRIMQESANDDLVVYAADEIRRLRRKKFFNKKEKE